MNSNKDSITSDHNKENLLIIPDSNTADVVDQQASSVTDASTFDANQEIEDEFKNQEGVVSNENANDYSEQIVVNTEEYQMYQQHQQQQQQHQINPIPSAYSWRLISTNYYPPAVLQPSHNTYHHPIIDFDSSTQPQQSQQQQQQQQQPQWQNDHAVASTASTAYLAPVSQYVGTPQATTPVYSLDPNAEIAYDHFGYQNVSYNYQNNYNGNMMPQPAWSSHPVNTNPAYTPNYDNTNSPNSTSNKQQQHQYQFSYDDYYSKDKLRSTPMGINSSGSLAYHYVPADPVMYNNHLSNIKNNVSTSSLAQHIHTDNNNFSSTNGFYMNTTPYHRVNHYHEANIINGYPNKHVNGKAAKMYENDSGNKKKSYQNKIQKKTSASQIDENNNSDKKRYSDIVAGDPTTNNINNNVGNINNSNVNETSLSISPQNTLNKNQDEKNFEENNGNTQNFYNPIYNASHSNQYQKKTNYKQPQSFYGQQQYHDSNLVNSAHLEAEMANLNLFSRFYPFNSTYSYENTKQKYRPNTNKTSNTRNSNLTYDQYNPKDFYVNGEHEGNKKSKFFVIKSYSKDDVIHCIRHGIWCSTEEGNKKLDKAFVECSNEKHASVYLFFSVNGSGQFCGMAQMMSRVDYDSKSEIWSQDKWQGTFEVKWIFIKDVPNVKLRHIVLFNNENKPVTNSRDTQEVFYDDAIQVLNVVRQHLKKSSILDEYDSDVPNQFDYSTKDTSKQYVSERKNKNNF